MELVGVEEFILLIWKTENLTWKFFD